MKIPKCLIEKVVPFLWKTTLKEIDDTPFETEPSYKELELKRFTEDLLKIS